MPVGQAKPTFDVIEGTSTALDLLLDTLLGPITHLDVTDWDVSFPPLRSHSCPLAKSRDALDRIDLDIQKVTLRARALRHSTLKVKRILQNLESTRKRHLAACDKIVAQNKRPINLPSEIVSFICQLVGPRLFATTGERYRNQLKKYVCDQWGIHLLRSAVYDLYNHDDPNKINDAVTWKERLPSLRFDMVLKDRPSYFGQKTVDNVNSILPTAQRWYQLTLTGSVQDDYLEILKEAVFGLPLPALRVLEIGAKHAPSFVGSGLFNNVTRLSFSMTGDKDHASLPQILAEVPLLRSLTIRFGLNELGTNGHNAFGCSQVKLFHLTDFEFWLHGFKDVNALQMLLRSLPFSCEQIKRLTSRIYMHGAYSAENVERETKSFLNVLNTHFPALEYIGGRWLTLGIRPERIIHRHPLSHIAVSSTTLTPLFPHLNHIQVIADNTPDTSFLLQRLARSRFENPRTSRLCSVSLVRDSIFIDKHSVIQQWVDTILPYYSNVLFPSLHQNESDPLD